MSKPSGQTRRKPPIKPPATVTRARFEAFTILMELERASLGTANAHADDLLRSPRVSALYIQDRNLCTTLVLGTLRWQIRLDAAIRTLLAKPNAKLDPAIRIALRLGLFQLHYLDRIPAHAAISESVSLAKLAGHQHASRMVNAVLRMLSEQPKPDLAAIPADRLNAAELAAAMAHPLWLVERWIANYGFRAAQAICQNGQRQSELNIRLENPEAEAELAGQGIELAPGAMLTAARRVLSGDVTATGAFHSGRVRIQEEGSQLIAELAGDGRSILDCCAAPGGKTFILAERNPHAKITALEIGPQRYEALKTRVEASPYASQIEAIQADASELPSDPAYDLILADVPCSGTGTLGRNPEIRHRLQPVDLNRHHERQLAILGGALRAGSSRVLYSTCSLEPEENISVVTQALAQNPEWRQTPVSDAIRALSDKGRIAPNAATAFLQAQTPDGSLTILPGSLGPELQTDGFFLAILEKRRSTSPR